MFERQFGLRENPFAAGHQARFVYPSREHQEALAHLRYGIENREPFVLITGEVGTGKTTALYDVLGEWQSRAVVALVTNSALTRDELLEEIGVRFGTGVPPGVSKPQMLLHLERHLLAIRAQGLRAILILDEAQNLNRDLLEEVRLLSNLESAGEKLIQIFLVGQPELEAILTRPELRQLRQRIAVFYRLHPLSEDDTERYIHHRLTVAGGHAISIFPADACREVYRLTHGIPREINTVAAQAMLNAFVEDSPVVLPAHVTAVASETEFQSVARGPEPADAPDPVAASVTAPAPGAATIAAPAAGGAPAAPLASATAAPVAPPAAPPADEGAFDPPVPPTVPPTTSSWPVPPPALRAEPPASEPPVRPAASSAAWEAWRSSFAEDVVRAAESAPADAGAAHGADLPPDWVDETAGEAVWEAPPAASQPAGAMPPTAAGMRDDADFEETNAWRAPVAAAAPREASVQSGWSNVEAREAHEGGEPADESFARRGAGQTSGSAAAARAVELESLPPRLRRKLEFEDAEPAVAGGSAMRWVLVAAAVVVVAAAVWLGTRLGTRGAASTAREAATAGAPAEAASPRSEAAPAPARSGSAGTVAHGTAPAAAPGGANQPAAQADPTQTAPASRPDPAAAAAPPPSRSAALETAPTHGASAAPPAAAASRPAAGSGTTASAPAATTPAAPARLWGIAVATFLAEERAGVERDKLAASTGLPARVAPVTEAGDVSYRVILGAFPDRAAADRAASDLIEKGLIDEARVLSYARLAAR
uniref:SPOR domain-containing protein n=1 Tax=Eiseniibacteriota bacterium TaxID=2212470 RepID=A0A832I3G2_UNCEI